MSGGLSLRAEPPTAELLTWEPLTVYAALLSGREHAIARLDDGSVRPVGVSRWLAVADQTDQAVLGRLAGPVLDVGCGPGRHLHALARRGVFGLGVDICPAAIALARGGGAAAIVASVFDELPGAGRWRSALLLDGNIGIGGDPVRLLRRLAELLVPGGEILIEVSPPGSWSGSSRMRLETPTRTSDWFPWAEVAASEVRRCAQAAGCELGAVWDHSGRWFALLRTVGSHDPGVPGGMI